jgi:hypothetical protein
VANSAITSFDVEACCASRVLDLTGVDHRRGQLHAVEKAEAGIGDVETLARGRQPDRVVHRCGGRRLQVRPADRGVDEQADVLAADTGLGDGLAAGQRRAIGEGGPFGPPAPGPDTGQPFDQPGPQAHSAVGVGQLLVQLRRGHHDRGVDRGDGEHTGVTEPKL